MKVDSTTLYSYDLQKHALVFFTKIDIFGSGLSGTPDDGKTMKIDLQEYFDTQSLKTNDYDMCLVNEDCRWSRMECPNVSCDKVCVSKFCICAC